MNHGHELKGGNACGRGCAGWRGIQGEKWDTCNSIINKIFFEKIYKLLHSYYYPANNTQVDVTCSGPCILYPSKKVK